MTQKMFVGSSFGRLIFGESGSNEILPNGEQILSWYDARNRMIGQLWLHWEDSDDVIHAPQETK